jgi:hypothetical protein
VIWSVKNVSIILVFIALAAWFLRYEYVTRTINNIACVERINRFTGDRCLFSTDIPTCTHIVASRPCEK